ncbi:LVIVD repeat-containing protein [Flavimarina sp. Hel_I_48]|uniref:LVIVD repeat-containing protein n=1 Tax=Flavimarina sp. Hel_I_48 TaxID=1392488 RepID=UPI0004DFB10D|nr:hypothetical protein [Flavimarina sp. Hel_I_48]
MNKALLFLLFISAIISCKDDDNVQYAVQDIATPIVVDKADLRASYNQLVIESPKPIENSGKFYAYGNFIFINDLGAGIHIIDNTNPSAPVKKGFLEVPGSRDMEAKDNILYVDSYSDLVLFDLSNINAIKYLKSYENILGNGSYEWPRLSQQVDQIDYKDFDAEKQIVVGWEYARELRPVNFYPDGSFEDALINTANGNNSFSGSGLGGSFARFNVVDDRLYIINEGQLFVFDVTSQQDPALTGKQNLTWNVETIFNQGDFLYMGSPSGMLIYDIQDIDNPLYVSEVTHVLGCDPVVVEGDYAYVTVRGGNACGQDLSFLEVLDISDKTNPVIVNDYDMIEPYGLGIHGDQLFVSDGQYGLHIYDKTDPKALKLVINKGDLNIFDVIPMEDKLLMIGGQVLHQYKYTVNGISEMSTFQLD